MANIPTPFLFGEAQKVPAKVKAIGDKSGLIRAVGEFGQVITHEGIELEHKTRDLQRISDYTDIMNDVSRKTVDLDHTILSTEQPDEVPIVWEDTWKEISDIAEEAASHDSDLLGLVKKDIANNKASSYQRMRSQERSKTIDYSKATFYDLITNASRVAKDDASAMTYLGQLTRANDAYTADGLFTKEEHSVNRETISKALVNSLVANMPLSEALIQMEKKTSMLNKLLSPEEKLALQDKLINKRMAEIKIAEMLLDKELEVSEQNISEQIDKGEIDEVKLNELRDQKDKFRPEKYDSFKKQIRDVRAGKTGDNRAFEEILSKLHDPRYTNEVTNKTINQAEQDANSYLSPGQARQLRDELKKVRTVQAKLPTSYSVGLKLISDSIYPSMVSLNPRAEEKSKYLPVARQYLDYASTHTGATPAELIKMAESLIDSAPKRKQTIYGDNPYLLGIKSEADKQKAIEKLLDDFNKDKKNSFVLHLQGEYNAWHKELKELEVGK